MIGRLKIKFYVRKKLKGSSWIEYGCNVLLSPPGLHAFPICLTGIHSACTLHVRQVILKQPVIFLELNDKTYLKEFLCFGMGIIGMLRKSIVY